MALIAIVAGIVLAYTPFGQQVYATGGNRRAADYAGINTRARALHRADVLRLLRHHGRHHLRRLLPQLQPHRRPVPRARRHRLGHHRRRLDLRRLRHASSARSPAPPPSRSSARCCSSTSSPASGASFVMPQHWVNVFIGVILIVAVLIDIWLRQANILGEPARSALRNARHGTAEVGGASLRPSRTPDRRDAADRQGVRRRPRAQARSISSSTRARSWGSSATTRPASRR